VEHFIFFFISVAPDTAEGICASSLNAERINSERGPRFFLSGLYEKNFRGIKVKKTVRKH
jgi:hypothetical protein